MNEKKQKNPIIVILAIIFLAMFIVLPPLFRKMYPKEEDVVEVVNKSHILTCERISVVNNYKISYKVTYNNGKPTKNVVLFDYYTPTEAEKTVADSNVMTAEEELNYFKGIEGVEVAQDGNRFSLTITSATIDNVDVNSGLNDYFKSSSSEQQMFFEEQGYSCSIVEL